MWINKEDQHCCGERFVTRVDKKMNVLVVGAMLLGNDLEFSLDVMLGVSYPV